MIISFFEEFPTTKNLRKLRNVHWPTKLYVGAKSLPEFEKIASKIKNKNVKEIIYWPILNTTKGYWISPWADTDAVEHVFQEVCQRKNKSPLSMMIYLEPPKQRIQIIARYLSMFLTKRKIEQFLHDAPSKKIKVYTAELSHLSSRLLRWTGLSYPSSEYKHQRIAMYYTSFMRPFLPEEVVEECLRKKAVKCAVEKMSMGIGLIAPGVYKTEPAYSVQALGKEVEIVMQAGIQEVIIFRLGGLNENYVKIIASYLRT